MSLRGLAAAGCRCATMLLRARTAAWRSLCLMVCTLVAPVVSLSSAVRSDRHPTAASADTCDQPTRHRAGSSRRTLHRRPCAGGIGHSRDTRYAIRVAEGNGAGQRLSALNAEECRHVELGLGPDEARRLPSSRHVRSGRHAGQVQANYARQNQPDRCEFYGRHCIAEQHDPDSRGAGGAKTCPHGVRRWDLEVFQRDCQQSEADERTRRKPDGRSATSG